MLEQGSLFTRREIHEYVGGDLQTYLPQSPVGGPLKRHKPRMLVLLQRAFYMLYSGMSTSRISA